MAATALSPAAKEIVLEKLDLEEMTTNVDAVQERVLAEILVRNAGSEYLAKFGLAAGGGATSRAAFRAKVPMVTYEELKPYILRIANGDRSPILTGSRHPIAEFFISSGTSGGEPKLIPVVKDEFDRRHKQGHSLVKPDIMNQQLGKGNVLNFPFVRSETTTPSGLPARSATTSLCKSDHFKNLARQAFTSPMAAILCPDVLQSMYAQVVCGLCLRHDVLCIRAWFASTLVRVIQFLQQQWEQLAADIEAGELSPTSVSDPTVREAVAGVLRPDPELARFIRAECSKGDWAGIISRVWPNTRYLDTIATGSMAQYVPALNYYSGGLPIASNKYVSSECFIGINLRPMCDPTEVSYTIMPNMAYFEFLPTNAAADATSRELVELADVEAGREYEVVVTTYSGLSRYRIGDVLRVTGFHNAAPQFRIMGRRNVLLSLDADKTTDAELQCAVERASTLLRPHGAAVLDYTSQVSTKIFPGHYILYWELLATQGALTTLQGLDGDVLERCCLEMEEALSYVYRELRVDGSIGPLEIRVVRSGTFEELADYATSHGSASMAQYKVPRCVTVPAIIQLLQSRVVSSHFSPGFPHWAPGPGL